MNDSLAEDYLRDSVSSFRAYKKLADRAIEQVKDDELFVVLDAEANSIAVIMKHMAGNMISRWTDFLTSDGEKPDRNRDLEFVIDPQTSREDVLTYWARGWQTVFQAVEPLQPQDLGKMVYIRGQEHTVVQAINRQTAHYAYHIGQIVFLAKHFRSSEWKSLSIPRNQSAQFNTFAASSPASADREQVFDAAREFTSQDEQRKSQH
jgi:hypothetical protein